MNAVDVKDMSKVYHTTFSKHPVVAVQNLNFHVGVGEVYGLIGPNGSGKSTTLKVILGLITASLGQTEVFGIDSGKVGSRRDVGFLPENPYFYKYLTGSETLKFYGRLCGLTRDQIRERIPNLLKMVDLEAAADRPISGYSKGMLQRIGLAQALIHEPRLVVLDEPTAGVDPRGSRKIRDLILQMKEQGISVILSSHLLEQVQEVCDRVGIIFKGKMVQEGTLEELTQVEDQEELIIEGASPELLAKIRATIEGSDAKLIRSGKPRTSLERLFLDATKGEAKDADEKE